MSAGSETAARGARRTIDADGFRALIRELIDENPFAIRPLLRIAGIEFTESVPTLAVTCEESPTLKVNLAFLAANCENDSEAKAVVLHEFFHILLRHTSRQGPVTEAEHLAADAVINAIIHRQAGCGASAMMSRYYAGAKGLMRLLRPPRPDEIRRVYGIPEMEIILAWSGLYSGRLVFDDIRELAETFAKGAGTGEDGGGIRVRDMLGGHDAAGEGALPEPLAEALDKSLRTMTGGGLWRANPACGIGAMPAALEVTPEAKRRREWEAETLRILRAHLVPDPKAAAQRFVEGSAILPVLGPRDRRAFALASTSPILPFAEWTMMRPRPEGSAQVYLDVSGSMANEMPAVIALLARFKPWIRMPFWAFSDAVTPARIERGRLVTESSGGTSLAAVLRHLAATRPEAAVIVTDGFVGRVDRQAVRQLAGLRIKALVTRSGSTLELETAGLPCTQLKEYPR